MWGRSNIKNIVIDKFNGKFKLEYYNHKYYFVNLVEKKIKLRE